MEMWLGPTERGSVFASEAEQRAYWFANDERIMLMVGGNARRPWGWWQYVARMRHPGLDHEAAVLYELGELGVAEEREWIPVWRRAFDHVRTLRGLRNIRDYLDSAVLPRTLFERWNAERRRARKQIRELEAAAIEGEPGNPYHP
jgi:hypothetical protein